MLLQLPMPLPLPMSIVSGVCVPDRTKQVECVWVRDFFCLCVLFFPFFIFRFFFSYFLLVFFSELVWDAMLSFWLWAWLPGEATPCNMHNVICYHDRFNVGEIHIDSHRVAHVMRFKATVHCVASERKKENKKKPTEKNLKQNENNNKLTVNAGVAAFCPYITKTCNQMVRHCQPLNLERICIHCVCMCCCFTSTISSIHQNVGANILAILHTSTYFTAFKLKIFLWQISKIKVKISRARV